jgi:hypothetical protein
LRGRGHILLQFRTLERLSALPCAKLLATLTP